MAEILAGAYAIIIVLGILVCYYVAIRNGRDV